jgi:hypothetical protein
VGFDVEFDRFSDRSQSKKKDPSAGEQTGSVPEEPKRTQNWDSTIKRKITRRNEPKSGSGFELFSCTKKSTIVNPNFWILDVLGWVLAKARDWPRGQRDQSGDLRAGPADSRTGAGAVELAPRPPQLGIPADPYENKNITPGVLADGVWQFLRIGGG